VVVEYLSCLFVRLYFGVLSYRQLFYRRGIGALILFIVVIRQGDYQLLIFGSGRGAKV
jgi:hypothetical protein